MADNLSLATIVVAIIAIAFTLSPISLRFLTSIFSIILCAVWPRLRQCEVLGWDNIPSGRLHTCTIPRENCPHLGTLNSKQSWDSTIGSFFTHIKRGVYVRKPVQLDLFTTYVRTDRQTLRVLWSFFGFYGYQKQIRLVFKDVGGITTAYFQAGSLNYPSPTRIGAKKEEMELILRGYPPWYKQPLRISNGRFVPHPIKTFKDISRGGWVIAIGFGRLRRVSSMFMEFEEGYRWRPPSIHRAFKRVLHSFGNLKKAFPEDSQSSNAYSLMEEVIELDMPSQTILGNLFRYSKFSQSANHRTAHWYSNTYDPLRQHRQFDCDFTEDMTESQVITAMEVFNCYEAPSEEEINCLRPVLGDVLSAALAGVYSICDEDPDNLGPRMIWKLPKELENDGFVYLRERRLEYED